MKIDLRIGELRLEGVAPSQRHAVAAAVEQELTRTLSGGSSRASLRRSASVARLRAPDIERWARPAELGRRIGQSIESGLSSRRAAKPRAGALAATSDSTSRARR